MVQCKRQSLLTAAGHSPFRPPPLPKPSGYPSSARNPGIHGALKRRVPPPRRAMAAAKVRWVAFLFGFFRSPLKCPHMADGRHGRTCGGRAAKSSQGHDPRHPRRPSSRAAAPPRRFSEMAGRSCDFFPLFTAAAAPSPKKTRRGRAPVLWRAMTQFLRHRRARASPLGAGGVRGRITPHDTSHQH